MWCNKFDQALIINTHTICYKSLAVTYTTSLGESTWKTRCQFPLKYTYTKPEGTWGFPQIKNIYSSTYCISLDKFCLDDFFFQYISLTFTSISRKVRLIFCNTVGYWFPSYKNFVIQPERLIKAYFKGLICCTL